MDVQNTLANWQEKGVEGAKRILDKNMQKHEALPKLIVLEHIYCPTCGKKPRTATDRKLQMQNRISNANGAR